MAVHNGTVYLAGQVPDDATQDIRGQTAQVLAMVDKLLAGAGSDRTHPDGQIYLADMADFDGMNGVGRLGRPGNAPRATVQRGWRSRRGRSRSW
jgi:enamine deaminase RidA (YjgF/YER057c/UK114 family)